MSDFDKYMLELEKKHKEISFGLQVETVAGSSSVKSQVHILQEN